MIEINPLQSVFYNIEKPIKEYRKYFQNRISNVVLMKNQELITKKKLMRTPLNKLKSKLIITLLLLTSFYSYCQTPLEGKLNKNQEYKENQTIQTIIHKIVIPENGSLKEALDLTQEWTENVLRKNENFENIQLLISDTKKDTIDLMVLYKYKLNITRSTNEINQELINKHWTKKEAFENFINRLHVYINPKMNERTVFRELILN